MSLEEQLKTARDITPAFGVMTFVRDGKTVNVPLLDDCGGALFIADDQGEVLDGDGSRWLVGTWSDGQVVKRRIG